MIDETTHGTDHPEVAIRLNNLARVLEETGRYAEAESLLRRALAIHEKGFGSDDLNVGICVGNLASLL
jgi:hypothetical protein